MDIQSLHIKAKNISACLDFYQHQMGLLVNILDNDSLTIRIGESTLMMDEDANAHPIHFAINIPEGRLPQAKEWLRGFTSLALETGKDEVTYENLSAVSCYFYDPAGNIVELISRVGNTEPEQAGEPRSGKFTANEFISIGEVGVASKDMERDIKKLEAMGIPRRDAVQNPNMEIVFMGEFDGAGFIILSPLGRRWFFSDLRADDAEIYIQTSYGQVKYPA